MSDWFLTVGLFCEFDWMLSADWYWTIVTFMESY